MRWDTWKGKGTYRPSIDPPGYTISRTGPEGDLVYLAWAPREGKLPNPIGARCETEDQARQLCEQHAAQAAPSSAGAR